ncbi:MAG: phosphatase PAP2 family protein [Opitutales bacterium]
MGSAATHDPGRLPWGRFGRPEVVVVAAVMAVTLAVAWFTSIDQATVRWFYDADGPEAWPLANHWLSRFFYYSAPVLASILGLGAVAVWTGGRVSIKLRRWRWHALFMLLVLVLGPGLVVNAIFKDYSGRPRPRQTTEFGGPYAHRAPLEFGKIAAGKSFPAGHASVGFAYCGLYFVLRRHRRRAAFTALGASLGFGLLMGVCRMAAGAHFFSDVIFAGALTFLVAHVTYFFLLKIPEKEAAWEAGQQAPPRTLSRKEKWGYGSLAGVIACLLLFVYPYHRRFESRWLLPDAALSKPTSLEVFADRGDVVLDFTQPQRHLEILGVFHGFGLPEKTVHERIEADIAARPVELFYAHDARGVFTDFEGRVTLFLDRDRIATLKATAPEGAIFVEWPEGSAPPPETWELAAPAVFLPEPAE